MTTLADIDLEAGINNRVSHTCNDPAIAIATFKVFCIYRLAYAWVQFCISFDVIETLNTDCTSLHAHSCTLILITLGKPTRCTLAFSVMA